MTRARRRRVLLMLAALFLAYNLVCFLHARSMLFYTMDGRRTPAIEDLTTVRKIWVLATGVRVPKPRLFRTPAEEGLPYATLKIPADERPELEVWTIDATNARGTAFLFHGYSDCKSGTLPEASAFHGLGWNVWLTDFAGSGGSGGRSTSIGFHEARDVVRVLHMAESRGAPRPYVLYGMSMGAAAALRATAELGAQPDGLILASVFERMTGAIGARFNAMGLPAWPTAQTMAFWGGLQQGMNGLAWNPVDLAPRVRVPTLLLHGRLDTRAPLIMASNVMVRLAGPAELAVFETAAHESLHRRDPARWQEAVGPWLEKRTFTPK